MKQSSIAGIIRTFPPVYDEIVTELEVANVVGMITYQQELDLTALAETFDERDEITDVTYEPADNHWLQTRFAPGDTYAAFYRTGLWCGLPRAGQKKLERIESSADSR